MTNRDRELIPLEPDEWIRYATDAFRHASPPRWLGSVGMVRAHLAHREHAAIEHALAFGYGLAEIAHLLGVSRQSMHQRYGGGREVDVPWNERQRRFNEAIEFDRLRRAQRDAASGRLGDAGCVIEGRQPTTRHPSQAVNVRRSPRSG